MAATIGLSGEMTKREASWVRAINRAENEGTDGKFIARWSDGSFTMGLCAGNHDELYRIEGDRCDCLAGANGIPCKHVAALFSRFGLMDQLVPNFYARVILPAPDGQAAA